MAGTLLSIDDFREALTGWEELEKVLSRPPGLELSELQAARADYFLEKAHAGTLKLGESWAILTGQRDEELHFKPPQAHRANPRKNCKRCGQPLTDENRSNSDPARCQGCRRILKREYNRRYRGTP